MKTAIKLLIGMVVALMASQVLLAQKIDEEKMNRDIEVAEKILSTLIKQEFEKRDFFPVEVKGSYLPGFGITFTLPDDRIGPVIWLSGIGNKLTYDVQYKLDKDLNYSVVVKEEKEKIMDKENKKDKDKDKDKEKEVRVEVSPEVRVEISPSDRLERIKEVHRESPVMMRRTRGGDGDLLELDEDQDSLQNEYYTRVIQASKIFLSDYGDLISQLSPQDKILITNQSHDELQGWKNRKRHLIALEVVKNDLLAYKKGTLNREQLLSKIKVTHAKTVREPIPDLELLVSIMDRLYERDLSKTYFSNGRTYYERLNDFGAILHFQVYSSFQLEGERYDIPTLGLKNVSLEERNKKVKEMFPLFEKELKENILDYGRTLKSLKDNESLVFKVSITRCKGCGIPENLEMSIKMLDLREFSSGKVEKSVALTKFTIKRGELQ